jgi:hypothetical protein
MKDNLRLALMAFTDLSAVDVLNGLLAEEEEDVVALWHGPDKIWRWKKCGKCRYKSGFIDNGIVPSLCLLPAFACFSQWKGK